MTSPKSGQHFASHARWVPGYHFLTGTLTIVVFGWSMYRLVTQRSADTVFGAMLGFSLLAQGYYLRAFPLAVQDRLIRLEEHLRLERLLPADMKSLIPRFSSEQLIAMRFASDEELPALAKKVLDGGVSQRKSVKAMVQNWRPDHMRA